MDDEGVNHVCVVDGDLVIAVVSRASLEQAKPARQDAKLFEFLENRVRLFDSALSDRAIGCALAAVDASYGLLTDDAGHLCGLVERSAFDSETCATAAMRDEHRDLARVMTLNADQQAGAAGDFLRVYAASPHLESDGDQ